MSDKQIVERNGVSMDSHSSTVGGHSPWKNEAAIASEGDGDFCEVCGVIIAYLAGSKVSTCGHKIRRPASEVEAANICGKPLLGGSVCQLPPGSHDGYCTNWNFELGRSVVSDAASKLPAPLTEDAPKLNVDDVAECRWCHFIIELRQFGEGIEWIHATNNRKWCEVEPHFAEPKVPASPVGEREGEFENEPPTCERCEKDYTLTDFDFEPTKYCDACAHICVQELESALASKSSPEVIPETTKTHLSPKEHAFCEELLKIRTDPAFVSRMTTMFMDACCERALKGGYAEFNGRAALESLLSAKDAEIARLTDLVRFMRHELHAEDLISSVEFASLVADSDSGNRVARLETYDFHRKRAESAEAELSSLKLSSALLLDAINWVCGCSGEFPGRSGDDGAYYWRPKLTKRAGLTYDGKKFVIPTSPESQAKDGK